MAREFDGTMDEFLRVEAAVVTAAPFTVSAWIRPRTLPRRQTVWWMGDSTKNIQYWRLITLDVPEGIEFHCRDGATCEAITTSAPTVDTWHHVAGVEASTTNRSAYLDGGSKGTDLGTCSPQGANRTTIGRTDDFTPSHGFDGDIAHVAMWNVALTDQEIATLAAGANPRQVRPDSLVFYCPVGGQAPEIDIVGGLSLSVTGAPAQVEEPPIPWSVVTPGT